MPYETHVILLLPNSTSKWAQGNETPTLLSPKYVTMDITGAANAKTSKCFLMRFRSSPACIKKETRPKAAGACKKPIVIGNTILSEVPQESEIKLKYNLLQ